MAGKMPWIIGTYGPRTYSDRKPLIGTPLIYQYHTTLRYDAIPPNADALLAVAGRGQYGVQYGGATSKFRGMPVIYDFCWDAGLAVTGSQSGLEYAVGMINGAPGWMVPSQDNNNGKSVQSSGPQTWNDDFDRIETGVGYRIARGSVLKAVYQANYQHHLDETHVHELWATQLSVSF
jgi:hypothetical protein